MGVKSRIEQSIKRARREGRLEDAADFEQDLIALKAQRGQTAMERGRSYTVQPGDSYFSIAADQLGDERWAKSLVQANPEIQFLKPGMIIVIPRARGEAPSFEEQEYDDFVDKYDMEPDSLMEPESDEQSQEAVATEAAAEMLPEEAEQPAQPETAPGAMTPEEEDALVDDLVALFRALEQQGAAVLPEKKATSLPKQKTTGQKLAAGKAVQTPPPPTGTPNLNKRKGTVTWADVLEEEAHEGNQLPPPITATPTPTETPVPPIEYQVQEGDTLLGLVLEYGVSLKHLHDFNQDLASDNSLQIGQNLIIPIEFANNFKPTDFIQDEIIGFEGYLENPDEDPAGNCSVGYGHTIHEGACDGRVEEAPFQDLQLEEILNLFEKDLLTAEETVKAYVDVSLNQNQFDALVSFVYNLGTGRFIESTVLDELNAGNIERVPDEIRLYVYDNVNQKLEGLVRRRNFEAYLFSKDSD